MSVVIADTSPLNYLILVDAVDVLQTLYSKILIPVEVFEELISPGAPPSVAAWAQSLPDWVELRTVRVPQTLPFDADLDPGEKASICLALAEPRSKLLIDEALGRSVATRLGIRHTGTLGVLVAAASARLLDLPVVLEKLRRTNFRVSQSLLDSLLKDR